MPHPKSGYRLKNGDRIPGTTTICNRWKDSGGLIQWAFTRGSEGFESLYESRDQAGQVGTIVHSQWEALISEKAMPDYPTSFTDDMKKQAESCLGAALRWYQDSGLKVYTLEEPMVSEVYRYGGCADGYAIGKRGTSLIDYKSGSGIWPETWMQVAAYLNLVKENRPDIDITDGCHVLRLGKNGGEFSHLHIPLDHPGLVLAWEQFQALIGCYDRDKRLKKLT